MNTASWDTNFPDPAIASDLSAAGTGLIRYPGGSYADGYLWQSNTYQGTADPVNFAQYSSQVDTISGGQKFVTVNYGSDTPAERRRVGEPVGHRGAGRRAVGDRQRGVRLVGDRQPRQPAHRRVLRQQRPGLPAGDEGG